MNVNENENENEYERDKLQQSTTYTPISKTDLSSSISSLFLYWLVQFVYHNDNINLPTSWAHMHQFEGFVTSLESIAHDINKVLPATTKG